MVDYFVNWIKNIATIPAHDRNRLEQADFPLNEDMTSMERSKTRERGDVGHGPQKSPSYAAKRNERMVLRQPEADGSVRYVVTKALLRRAAKAASRKNFEAA